MSMYVFIVAATVGCCIWHACSSSRVGRFWASIVLLLALIVPAAIRDEVGGDCVNVYVPAIEQIQGGEETDFEPVFVWMTHALDWSDDVPRVLFAVFSCLTYAFAVMAFRGSVFPWAVIAYVLIYFPFSLSGIRQALALSLMFSAYRMFVDRKWTIAVLLAIFSVLSHYTIMLMPILLSVAYVLSRNSWKRIGILALAIGACACFVDLMSLLQPLVAATRYAKYLSLDHYMNEAQLSSGLGVGLMLGVAALYFVVCRNAFEESDRVGKQYAILCVFSFVLRALGTHCEALMRLPIIGDACFPLAAGYLCTQRRAWRIRLMVVVSYLVFLAIYYKDVSNPDGGYMLYPYKTYIGE